MALTRKTLITLRERDKYCVHCGTDTGLVPHHRRNRAMGGSKLLDGLDNLLMVCAQYNGDMESNANIASQARDYGHKLGQWQDFTNPVFDEIAHAWFTLDKQGNRIPTAPPTYLI